MTSEPDLNRPLTLAEFVNRFIDIYRVGLWPMLLTASVLIIPAMILAVTQNVFIESALPAEADPAALGDVALSSAMWVLCLTLLGSVVSFLLIGLANIAITHQSDQALRRQRPATSEGLSVGWARMPAFIQMSLAQFMVYLTFAGLLLVLLLLTSGLTGADPAATLVGIVVVCGLSFIVLVPLLYLATRWALATSCLVIEQTGGIEALRRSWRLTQGQFWRAFLYIGLLAILTLSLFSLPGFLLSLLIGLTLGSVNPGLGGALGTAVQTVFTIGAFVFLMPAYVLLYYDLRARQAPPAVEEDAP